MVYCAHIVEYISSAETLAFFSAGQHALYAIANTSIRRSV